jgi:hypothetical protein
MHGAAVASLAVGKTIGVAPGADLYYIGRGENWKSVARQFQDCAQGVRRLIEIGKRLPKERKIRVISMSVGWSPGAPGYDDIHRATEEAKAAGMLVVCTNWWDVHRFHFHGLGRSPMTDPDEFASYEPGLFWAQRYYRRPFWLGLLVPMDSRATASPTGKNEFVFYRRGGFSWSVPYIAGLYALAAQIEPAITPQRFWEQALRTGRIIDYQHEGRSYRLAAIVDPPALMQALADNRK